MIKQVLNPNNLHRAMKQVIANRGNAGVDQVKTTELEEHFRKHKLSILQSIRKGDYQCSPILGVEPRNELTNTKKNRQK